MFLFSLSPNLSRNPHMNRKSSFFFAFLFFSLNSSAQKAPFKGYRFFIDLNQVQKSQLKVELKTPAVLSNSIIYHLPKIVPGMYSIDDYGRYVEHFKAYDKKGNLLPVQRTDLDSWKISHAFSLAKIDYWVRDTYDDRLTSQVIFEPGGSDIEKNRVFVINIHCFLGYLENMKDMPYELTVLHPSSMYGSTAMTDENRSPIKDKFITETYNQIVDNPILYTHPDTTVIKVGKSVILVSVYSPNHKVSSAFLARALDTLLQAQTKYLGGKLPVDRYAFIIFLNDKPSLSGSEGALEHSYSSFYYMAERDSTELASEFLDDAAHEFFHIITPLSIHSDKIQYFNFNDPQMSEHLWLYEGSTEYHAHMVQEKYGLISSQELLRRLGDKISASKKYYNDTLPFTVMSSQTVGKYKDQYENVYEKGALIAMCLDIRLLQLSGGKYGFANLMKDLSYNYGKLHGFKDEELFGIIEKLTYPEIGIFLRTYVSGNQPLPLAEIFSSVGVNFSSVIKTKDSLYTLGSVKRHFDTDSERFVVIDTAGMDDMGRALGYHIGDEIVSVNGTNLAAMSESVFNSDFQSDTAKYLVVDIIRKNEAGVAQEMQLKALRRKVPRYRYNVLEFSETPTPAELTLRNAWLKPNGMQVN
jgi:predicted metalloprotease with PDZ domain